MRTDTPRVKNWTYDGDSKAWYLFVDELEPSRAVARTTDLGNYCHVRVDWTADGEIVGVEVALP